MDNTEKLATQGTQDEVKNKKQKKQKTPQHMSLIFKWNTNGRQSIYKN